MQIPIAMRRNTTELVKKRFESLAGVYEKALEKSKYFGVAHMARVFSRHIDDGLQHNQFDVLDLGCGTGLCGRNFKPFARRLDGVDLSPRMLDIARNLGIYDQLYSGDVIAYFAQAHPNTYDIATSAGLFVYLNELQVVFNSCFSILRPGGLFVFTIDRHDGIIADVLPSPRSDLMFTYGKAYVERCLHSAGFRLIALEKIDDRLDWQNQEPVPAFVVLAMRPGGVRQRDTPTEPA